MKLKNKIGYFFKELNDEIDGIIRDVKEFMSAFYFVDWRDDKQFLSTGWFILFAGMVAGFFFDYNDMFMLFIKIIGFLIAYNVVRGINNRRVASSKLLKTIKFEISEAEIEIERYNAGCGFGRGIYDKDDAQGTLNYYDKYR